MPLSRHAEPAALWPSRQKFSSLLHPAPQSTLADCFYPALPLYVCQYRYCDIKDYDEYYYGGDYPQEFCFKKV